jgi:hypothetical protein
MNKIIRILVQISLLVLLFVVKAKGTDDSVFDSCTPLQLLRGPYTTYTPYYYIESNSKTKVRFKKVCPAAVEPEFLALFQYLRLVQF